VIASLLFLEVSNSQTLRRVLLARDDEKYEGARLHLPTALPRRRRVEIPGGKEDIVGLQVEGHGTGGALGGYSVDDSKFVWGILMNDRERPFTVGRKCEVRIGVEPVGIDAFSDRGSCDYLAGIRIDHRHHFVVAKPDRQLFP